MKRSGLILSLSLGGFERPSFVKPTAHHPKKPSRRLDRVFLDSSVLFAAVCSPTGGSFRILQESLARGLQLASVPYVAEEVETALREKYPDLLTRFKAYLRTFPFVIAPNPPLKSVALYFEAVPEEDAPILAAAEKSQAAWFLTLDKKHFLENPRVKRLRLPFEILSPGDLIKRNFR